MPIFIEIGIYSCEHYIFLAIIVFTIYFQPYNVGKMFVLICLYGGPTQFRQQYLKLICRMVTNQAIQQNSKIYYGYGMYWPQQSFNFDYQVPIIYSTNIPFQNNQVKIEQVDFTPKSALLSPSNQSETVIKSELPLKQDRNNSKVLRFSSQQKDSQEYKPYQKKRKNRGQKQQRQYLKDQNRNIMPNTVNKIFSFLRSKSKSCNVLNSLLEKNQNLKQKITIKKYYIYQNLIKSKMNKFIVEDNIDILFTEPDMDDSILSPDQKKAIVAINIGLLLYYLRKPSLFLSVVNSPRVGKHKIIQYLKNIRKIRIHIEEQSKLLREKQLMEN